MSCHVVPRLSSEADGCNELDGRWVQAHLKDGCNMASPMTQMWKSTRNFVVVEWVLFNHRI
ncbi:hypothetical protein ZHAS_00010090 [Anopheles sinensis]|uniref:Uncharacterized protein n=1 Tax=Anopheles sinensis TaxID=74873 RepID=A0A084VWQ2_ANOSI|nr:hypothetical protein ZHAS_00010090 [Anopheles sinensis]